MIPTTRTQEPEVTALAQLCGKDDGAAAIGTDDLRTILQDFSMDSASFYGKYGVRSADVRASLDATLAAGRGSLYAQRTLVLLYLRSIQLSIDHSAIGSGPIPEDEIGDLKKLVRRDPDGLGGLLQAIYEIPPDAGGTPLDWSKLQMHKVGTTSIIFRLPNVAHRIMVLKVSHMLFTGVGPIADANLRYYDDWGEVDCEAVVAVYASGTGWILESYVDGFTLREVLDRVDGFAIEDRLKIGSRLFIAICQALDDFHEAVAPRGHGDLTPANIMFAGTDVENIIAQPAPQVVLVDLGRNLLASEVIGRVRSIDTKYVAPEVIRLTPAQRQTDASADYFSLGLLLAACFGYSFENGFFFLPESLYEEFPDIARLAAPLLSADAQARVSYLCRLAEHGARPGEAPTSGLQRQVSALSDVLSSCTAGARAKSHVEVLVDQVLGEVSTFRDSLRRVAGAVRYRHTLGRSALVGPLRTLIAGLVYALVLVLIGLSWAGKLGGPVAQADRSARFQLYLISWSFALASYQYGTRALGSVTFIRSRLGGVDRVILEFVLWLTSTVVLPLTIILLFAGPRWWTWCVFAGLCVIVANNLLLFRLRRRVAVRITTIDEYVRWYSRSEIVRGSRTEILAYWTPTLVAYTMFALGLAILNRPFNHVHDLTLDAVLFAAVNVFVITWSQVYRQGPRLRANLCQHMVAAEVMDPG